MVIVTDKDILRKTSEPVDLHNIPLTTIKDMIEVLYKYRAYGLSAIQLGFPLRLAVIKLENTPLVLINPVILKSEGLQAKPETCLSVPGVRKVIKRPKTLYCRAYDADGKGYIIYADRLKSRIISHEIDHMNGVFLCL